MLPSVLFDIRLRKSVLKISFSQHFFAHALNLIPNVKCHDISGALITSEVSINLLYLEVEASPRLKGPWLFYSDQIL